MKELTIEDLKNVTWSQEDPEIVGTYNGNTIKTHQFICEASDVHPFYVNKCNMSEGWVRCAYPAICLEKNYIEEGSTDWKLSDFYKCMQKNGVQLNEEGSIKYGKVPFEGKIKILNEQFTEILVELT